MFIGKQCQINIKKDLSKDNQPLIIQSNSKNPKYLYPDFANDPHIVVDSGKSINVFCPGRTNVQSSSMVEPTLLKVKGKKFHGSKMGLPFKCLEEDEFSADGLRVRFSDISCEKMPNFSYNPVLRPLGTKCGIGSRYEIGFILNDGSFLKTIDLCHDLKTANTLWSHSIIESVNHVMVRFTGEKNKAFKTGILYENMSMSKDNPYNLENSFNSLVLTFNSVNVASKYASPKTSKSYTFELLRL